MKRYVSLLIVLCACTGGQTGTPTSNEMDGGIECPIVPDAATALGVTGEQLWQQIEGSYTFEASGSHLKGNELTWLDATSFEITITRTDESVNGLNDCAEVEVPVRVSVRSSKPALDVSVLGLLSGGLRESVVDFHAAGGGAKLDPHFQGGIFFQAGVPTLLKLNTDEYTSWTSPIPSRSNP